MERINRKPESQITSLLCKKLAQFDCGHECTSNIVANCLIAPKCVELVIDNGQWIFGSKHISVDMA